jgi:hypothetical protein
VLQLISNKDLKDILKLMGTKESPDGSKSNISDIEIHVQYASNKEEINKIIISDKQHPLESYQITLLKIIKDSCELFDSVVINTKLKKIQVKMKKIQKIDHQRIDDFIERLRLLTNCSVEQLNETTFILL